MLVFRLIVLSVAAGREISSNFFFDKTCYFVKIFYYLCTRYGRFID